MVLVYAKDSECALNSARKVVHEKLLSNDPFNYYVDFAQFEFPWLIHKDQCGMSSQYCKSAMHVSPLMINEVWRW